jgi:hypothetical protein
MKNRKEQAHFGIKVPAKYQYEWREYSQSVRLSLVGIDENETPYNLLDNGYRSMRSGTLATYDAGLAGLQLYVWLSNEGHWVADLQWNPDCGLSVAQVERMGKTARRLRAAHAKLSTGREANVIDGIMAWVAALDADVISPTDDDYRLYSEATWRSPMSLGGQRQVIERLVDQMKAALTPADEESTQPGRAHPARAHTWRST